MKLFKKKIAAAVLAASMAVAPASAFAAGTPDLGIIGGADGPTSIVTSSVLTASEDIMGLYTKAMQGDDSVDILYNSTLLQYTDVEPQIISDRVMIPFRAVLETMGAAVDYAEATRTVTATRGNTKISFSLDGTVIDIDKNGTPSQITMDVPMAVVNDRTLVPVRFMSNALGMNVGWDSNLRTVLIFDSEAYINELKALPNMGKMMSIKNKFPASQNGAFTVAFNAKGAFDADMDFRIDTAYDIVYKDGVAGGHAALNLDIDGLSKISGEDIRNLENVNFTISADEGVIYFKTDLVEKLAAAYPEKKNYATAAKIATKDQWFQWDLKAALNEAAKENPSYAALAKLVEGGISGMSEMTTEDTFKLVFEPMAGSDITMDQLMAFNTQLDYYKQMDKYITVNIEANGDYTVAFEINKEYLKNMIMEMYGAFGGEASAEDIAEMDKFFNEAIEFVISSTGSYKGGKSASRATIKFGLNIPGEGGFSINAEITATASGDENAEVTKPTVPKAAVDVMNVINALAE